MKKLIDKLEKECLIGLKDAGYGGWQTGFRDAIDIVRAHNPWHEVAKNGLPEPDKLLWFLCRDGNVFLGCYASYEEDGKTNYCWSEQNGTIYRWGNEIIVETVFDDDYDVTHYRYIPTDLAEAKP